jgi:uncharacterized membrane protein YdbT with pleckstrin-like domain
MTRYIDHILQPGETVAFTTTLHWVVYLPTIGLWLLAFIALMVGGALGPVSLLVAFVCALVGLGVAFSAWSRRWTTEIDVTDRRIVYKRGFIRRHTVEMNMDKVESVDVDQSILDACSITATSRSAERAWASSRCTISTHRSNSEIR